MTAKAIALDAIQKLPDESTFDELNALANFIERRGIGSD
jgi:hypothetical protein